MKIEDVARVCHEANRAYCQTLGDWSQRDWTDAPAWQRDSAVAGVKFHLENPNARPSGSHESWLKQKEEDGWKYGAVKNPDKKEHPCMVPFEKLPEDQQLKDVIFSAIVKSLVVAQAIETKKK